MCRIFPFAFIAASFLIPAANAQQVDDILRNITSPRWLLDQEAQERPTYYALLDGGANWLPTRILFRTGNESLLGLTDEQNERLSFLRKDNEIGREVMMKRLQSPFPEYEQAEQAMRATIPNDDPDFRNTSEEQEKAYVAAASVSYSFFDKIMDEEIYNTLTPEQMKTVQFLKMQLLPEMGYPSVSMFEPLGLSDEQKKEMEAIKQEMLVEFDLLVDEAMNHRREYFKAMLESVVETNRETPLTSWEEISKAMSTGATKAGEKPEFQQRFQEHNKKGQSFATRFRDRLMNVLTDEQLDEMQKIMDDSPDFVKQMLQARKQQRDAMERSGQYVPGPDSWRPGDPLPAQFKVERQQSRFPRSE